MNGFRDSFDLILLLAWGKDIQLLLKEYAKKYNLYLCRHYFYYNLYPGIVIKWFYRFTLRCLIATLRISKLTCATATTNLLALWSSRFSLSCICIYLNILYICICIYMFLYYWYLWVRLPRVPLLYLHTHFLLKCIKGNASYQVHWTFIYNARGVLPVSEILKEESKVSLFQCW